MAQKALIVGITLIFLASCANADFTGSANDARNANSGSAGSNGNDINNIIATDNIAEDAAVNSAAEADVAGSDVENVDKKAATDKSLDSEDPCGNKLAVSIVLDVSISINDKILQVMQNSVRNLLQSLTADDMSALSSFSVTAKSVAPITTNHKLVLDKIVSEEVRIKGDVGTNITAGLAKGIEAFSAVNADDYYKVIVLLSDGQHNNGKEKPVDFANKVKSTNGDVRIFSVAFDVFRSFKKNSDSNSPDSPDSPITGYLRPGERTMQQIASQDSDFKRAVNQDVFAKIFVDLKEQLCRQ